MLVDGEIEVLTAEEARTLPDAELRRSFIAICNELVGDCGVRSGRLIEDMPWLRERDVFDRMSTDEMRRIAVEQQYWFYPKESRR